MGELRLVTLSNIIEVWDQHYCDTSQVTKLSLYVYTRLGFTNSVTANNAQMLTSYGEKPWLWTRIFFYQCKHPGECGGPDHASISLFGILFYTFLDWFSAILWSVTFQRSEIRRTYFDGYWFTLGWTQ